MEDSPPPVIEALYQDCLNMNEWIFALHSEKRYVPKKKRKKKRKEEEGKSLNIKIIILFGVKTFKYAYR